MVAEYLGIPVYEVTLNADGGETRCMKSCDPAANAIVALAGHAANTLFDKASRESWAKDDLDLILSWGFRKPTIYALIGLARGMVKDVKPAVLHVADRLLRDKRVTRRTLRKLMREAGTEPDTGIVNWRHAA